MLQLVAWPPQSCLARTTNDRRIVCQGCRAFPESHPPKVALCANATQAQSKPAVVQKLQCCFLQPALLVLGM